MKAQIESTTKLVTLVVNGHEVSARIWEGHTENGVACHFFITRVAVSNDLDQSQFAAELQEHRLPSRAVERAYDARLIL